ncbi:MAG: hypothetical protein GXO65_01465, partial [Euryarchaeota archaeon]|nr:hypothetical protein [Euryarchaeota archaeon]
DTITLRSSNNTIQGFNITGGDDYGIRVGYQGYFGLLLVDFKSTGNTIANCSFYNSTSAGVYLVKGFPTESSDHNLIANSTFLDDPLVVDGAGYNNITGNVFTGPRAYVKISLCG